MAHDVMCNFNFLLTIPSIGAPFIEHLLHLANLYEIELFPLREALLILSDELEDADFFLLNTINALSQKIKDTCVS